jgi:hypothetical protein
MGGVYADKCKFTISEITDKQTDRQDLVYAHKSSVPPPHPGARQYVWMRINIKYELILVRSMNLCLLLCEMVSPPPNTFTNDAHSTE